MILLLLGTSAIAWFGLPPAPPASGTPSDQTCPIAQNASTGATAQELMAEARERLAKNDYTSARKLLLSALSAPGTGAARLGALRRLIAAQPKSDLGEIEQLLPCVQKDGRRLAAAWLSLRKGDYSAAQQQLHTSVLPRHHTSPRWSVAHETMGDAYAGLGRHADAQAQWRLALATNYDPGGTGYDPDALQLKLEAAVRSRAEPYLPLVRYHDALSIVDVGSIERTKEGVRYSKLVLLKKDENGTAYGFDSYEMDCDDARSRVIAVRAFDKNGDVVRESGSTEWLKDRHDEPFRPTERRLVCSLNPEMRLATSEKAPLEMLHAYRAGEPVFE